MQNKRKRPIVKLIPLVITLLLFTCQERVFENPHDETSVADPSSWAPTNLQKQVLADSTIELTWEHEAENIEGFKIDKQVGSLAWMQAYALLAKTDREWTDPNKVFDTTLTYRLYAYASSNHSAYDSITSFIQAVQGCTDIEAANHNPQAQVDDGSCIYPLIVISPDGGEEWEIGSEQTITWERNDLSRMIGGDYDLPQNKLITKKKRADKKSKTVINRQTNPQVPIMKGNKKPTMARSNIKDKIQELNSTVPMAVDNNSGKVKIELYSDGAVYAIIKDGTDDDGSYSWTITPDIYSGGSTYKIRITDITDTSVYAESESYFTLIEIPGCTNPYASNYDLTATIEDGSCTYDTPTEGLVAWYPFNGNAEDASGNGNNGTVNGATLITDRFGNESSAYVIDGVDDFVALTSPFNTVDDLDGTLCVWFNTLKQSVEWIIGQDFSGSNRDWWFAPNRNNAGRLVFMIDDGAGNNREVESDPGNDLSDGQWHQVCGLWGDAGMSMYIDGTLQSNTNAYDIYPNTAVASYIGCYRGGTYSSGTSCSGNFDGKVDDIHIYNRALNEAEITELYCDGSWCIEGCTNQNATNYNANANIDDGSCEYDLNDGLVAWYPFNGNANDASGNGNHGTEYGGVQLTTDRFGNEKSAYSFDGDGDGLSFSNLGIFGEHNYSISIWFNTNTITGGEDYLIDLGGERYTRILVDDTGGECTSGYLCWQIRVSNNTFYSVESEISADAWYYLVATFDYGSAGMKLYLDGSLADSDSFGGSAKTLSDTNGIGIYRQLTNYGFNGEIDEVRIYDRVLTEAEIEELYCYNSWCIEGCTDPNATNYNANANIDDGSCEYDLTYGLVAYYPFTNNTNDESGNSNHGQAYGGAATETEGVPGIIDNDNLTATSFDGVDDWVSFDINGTEQQTVSAWVYLTEDSPQRAIIQTPSLFTYFKNSTTIVTFIFPDNNGGPTRESLTCSYSLSTNTWHHWLSMKASDDDIRIYIDGELICSGIGINDNTTADWDAGAIGAWEINDSPQSHWEGRLQDVNIWNGVLSVEDITALYQSGTPTQLMSELISEDLVYSNPLSYNHGTVMEFDGVDDYVGISSYSFCEFGDNDNFTINFWKTNASNNNHQPMLACGHDYNISDASGWVFDNYNGTDWNTTGIRFVIASSATHHEEIYFDYSTILNDAWQMITIVNNGSQLNMFVNTINTVNGTVESTYFEEHYFKIGGYSDLEGNSAYYKGKLDEVRIYNRALSASEIQALYQQ